jgi:DNA-binding LytR/AlgR family response regulator
MKRVTAIVAEDEAPQRDALVRALGEVWPELAIVAECEDGLAALEMFEVERPAVAFIDIRMPGLSGLDLARRVGARTHLVFITAYSEHAVRAFEEGAIDYLLKPVSRERLVATVQRLRERVEAGRNGDVGNILAALQKQPLKPAPVHWVSASVGNAIKMLPIDEILFFQSSDKYTRVVTAEDEAVIRTPLKELLGMLDPEQFWQIHRGVIVRAAAIRSVVKTPDDKFELTVAGSAERLPVSPAFKRFKGM